MIWFCGSRFVGLGSWVSDQRGHRRWGEIGVGLWSAWVIELMCFCSLSVVVFLFPFPIVGGDEVVGLWFGCDFGGLFFFFFFQLLVVNGDKIVGLGLWFGYDFGGWWSWLWVVVTMAIVVAVVALTSGFIYFCFQWWWPAAASHGCGFAKKVLGFQRKGETQIRRERKKHIENKNNNI